MSQTKKTTETPKTPTLRTRNAAQVLHVASQGTTQQTPAQLPHRSPCLLSR